MTVTPLIWDSTFFGLRIGRTTISSEDDAATLIQMTDQLKKEFDLIYVFSNTDVIFPLKSVPLVDTKITYKKTLGDMGVIHPSVREWTVKNTSPELVNLALESGHYSRFKIDNRLPIGSFERLYTSWIEQSVKHIIATNVFCYYVDTIPRGLATLNIRKDSGNLGLVSIDRDYQHRHIGSALISHVCTFAYQHGARTLSVATQSSNIPACRFYERMGFTLESAVNVWHWWLVK
jgi:dTDP-4-amino-4,6-dideoxy-D-galactose acyltransferase